MAMRAAVKRGPDKGTLLYPHRHADGSLVVSPSRFEKDYQHVYDEAVAERLVREEGLKLRMSRRDGTAPSLICSESITFSGKV